MHLENMEGILVAKQPALLLPNDLRIGSAMTVESTNETLVSEY